MRVSVTNCVLVVIFLNKAWDYNITNISTLSCSAVLKPYYLAPFCAVRYLLETQELAFTLLTIM